MKVRIKVKPLAHRFSSLGKYEANASMPVGTFWHSDWVYASAYGNTAKEALDKCKADLAEQIHIYRETVIDTREL